MYQQQQRQPQAAPQGARQVSQEAGQNNPVEIFKMKIQKLLHAFPDQRALIQSQLTKISREAGENFDIDMALDGIRAMLTQKQRAGQGNMAMGVAGMGP